MLGSDAPPQPESTGSELVRDDRGRFVVGSKPPGGRPKGSRNKLAEDFIGDLHEKWQKHGAKAIERMAEEDPSGFVKVVAGILPKELKIDTRAEMTNEELEQRIQQLSRMLRVDVGLDKPVLDVTPVRKPDDGEPQSK